MKLLIDIGNTNIKIGLYDKSKLIDTFRIATDATKTADEYGMLLLDLLSTKRRKFDDVESAIISSVAPNLNYTMEHTCTYYTGKKPIFVTSKIKMPIKIDYNSPEELGPDRILNAVAAYVTYGGPVITVDFGSATTFGVVDKDGVFRGGLIAPGIKSSMEALINTTAKLPRIELTRPESVVAKSTIANMQSGIINGFVGLVEHIVGQIKEDPNFSTAKVVATGGLSQLVIDGGSKIFDVVDRALSITGLQILADLN